MKLWLVSALLLLASCGPTTIPVAVIGDDGRILTGTNTYSLSEGNFSVTDGEMTCAGSYDPLEQSVTISMPVTCDDGSKGIVRSTRDTANSGSGTFVLDNGYKGNFIFGSGAEGFNPKPALKNRKK